MLYIRTDMNDVIATGHMMRCLAIADAAKEQGEETVFLLADDAARTLLAQRGYAYRILYTKWNAMEQELSRLEEIIQELGIARLLIDSYQVTEAYLRRLSALVETYYIDDRNAFVYPVNGLICYAGYYAKFDYPARYPDARLYLGTAYAPLRRAFCGCPAKAISERAKRLLLLSGGSDPHDMLAGLLLRLKDEGFCRIDVICGMYHGGYAQLKETYRIEEAVHIHRAVSDIEQYMRQTDLAVSAGGMTLYELCACGVPSVSFTFADNQLDNARQMEADGLMDYAGDARRDDVISNAVRLIRRLRDDAALREERSQRMRKLVDGKGAERIAAVLSAVF